jgi:GT2 family glycosyltransferase
MSRILFWSGTACLFYSLVAFPAVVLARGMLRRREPHARPIEPRVSIVVAARNEEAVIGNKMENLLALDYPPACLEVIVASDGSTDRTNAILERYADRGVHLLALPRLGKAAMLNAAVEAASGEILVFTDANSEFVPGAVRELVAPFADEEVGGVAGDQRYSSVGDGIAEGEKRYWSFDRMMKVAESRAGHAISATGAIYAIRRELFDPVPEAVTDDFVISTGVIARGRRLVFAPHAIAHEDVATSPEVEFGRKVRIITRGLRAVLHRRALLDPRRHGFYAAQLFSHKVLRRLLAVPLAAVAVGSIGLWRASPFYRAAALAQGAFYGAALVGLAARERPIGRHPLFALPAFFCMTNAAAFLAAVNVLRGRAIDRWEPARSTAADGPSASLAETPERLLERIGDGLRRLRGDPATSPDASIVVPVNAQGDMGNVLHLLDDIVRYDGAHTLEVVLVVNNFPDGEAPAEAGRFVELGAVVVAEASVRKAGYAVPLMGRLRGLRDASSDRVLLFDADCRIPDPRSLVDWYVAELATAPVAYSHVDFYDLPPHPSVRLRRRVHHAARWAKRVILGMPTVRGSNYAVRRGPFLEEFERGTIADDMNIGPVFKNAGARIAYSGSARLVVLTSGRMFVGGWRRLLSYASYRLRYNMRVLPVRSDAVRRTRKEKDRPRRYVDNRPVR